MLKRERQAMHTALDHLRRAERYLMREDVAVARRERVASTTLHFTRGDGAVLYEVSKECGSDLTGLTAAREELERLLTPQRDRAS